MLQTTGRCRHGAFWAWSLAEVLVLVSCGNEASNVVGADADPSRGQEIELGMGIEEVRGIMGAPD